MLTFAIWPRCHTRRTSYNLRDVIKAIESCNLKWSREPWLIHVPIETVEQRKTLETALRAVHRNIPYRILTT